MTDQLARCAELFQRTEWLNGALQHYCRVAIELKKQLESAMTDKLEFLKELNQMKDGASASVLAEKEADLQTCQGEFVKLSAALQGSQATVRLLEQEVADGKANIECLTKAHLDMV